MQSKMTLAVAYMRCSGFGLGTDTWERQAEAIQNFARLEDYQLLVAFREDAVPGKLDREDRPAFNQMLDFLNAHDCKTVIVERLDRLARRFGTQESLLTFLIRNDITLYAADSGENVTQAMMGDPMRRALVQIQGIFAELDKNMTIAKLRKARERLRIANGKCEGRKAYGVKKGEKEVLERILSLTERGSSCEEIAEYLNQNSIPSRYGKRWHGATIFKILSRHGICEAITTDSR